MIRNRLMGALWVVMSTLVLGGGDCGTTGGAPDMGCTYDGQCAADQYCRDADGLCYATGFCFVASDCGQQQGLVTPACVGQWNCSANSCGYSCSASTLPTAGESCTSGGQCAPGYSCTSYYGIAGPSGPLFRSCEMPCQTDAACGSGLTCVTISDGPGRVCRARNG